MRKSQVGKILLLGGLLMAGCSAPQSPGAQKLRAGYDALSARQFDEALSAADQVLAEAPQGTLPAEARYLRGRVFEERAVAGQDVKSNLQAARTEYTTALAMTHKADLDGRLRAGVANVAFHQDDYGTALQQWRAAYDELERPEDRALTLYQLGRTAQRLGRWEEADKYFESVQSAAGGSDLANRARQIHGARAFTVQLATFSDARQADTAAVDLRRQGLTVQHLTDPAHPELHLLRLGPLPSYGEAIAIKARFAKVYPTAVILP